MRTYFIAKYNVEGFESATFDDCLSYLEGKPVVGLDIETTKDKEAIGAYNEKEYEGGLDPYLSNIVLIQLGALDENGGKTFVIDVRDYSKEELRPVLDYLHWNKKVTFVLVHGKFDQKHLKHKYGVSLHTIHDCMIVEMCLTNGLKRGYSLAALAERYLGVPQKIEANLFDDGLTVVTMDEDVLMVNPFAITPFELADKDIIDKSTRLQFVHIGDKPVTKRHIEYASDDIKYPLLIRERQLQGRLLPSGDVYLPIRLFNLENNVALALADMELNGMPIDQEMWLELAEKAENNFKIRKQALDEYVLQLYPEFVESPNLFDFTPKCLIEWSSPSQVIKLFKKLDSCPQEFSPSTKRKEYSVGATALKKLMSDESKKKLDRDKWEGFDVDENGKVIEDTDRLMLNYLLMKESEQLATLFGRTWLRHVHPVTGKIHSNFRQILNSGRMGSSKPNCFSMDTELLTPHGWKTANQLSVGDSIYAFDPDTETLEIQEVTGHYIGEGEVYEFTGNTNFKAKVTDNHRNLFRDRKNGKYIVRDTLHYLKDAHVICASTYGKGVSIEEDLLKLSVAFQADGTYKEHITNTGMRFSFTKQRKVKRLVDILNRLKFPYKQSVRKNGDITEIYVYKNEDVFEGLVKNKQFTYKYLDLTLELRNTFLEEIYYWDGDYTRRHSYLSKVKENTDVIQAVATISNKRTLVSQKDHNNREYSVISTVTDRNYTGTANTGLKKCGTEQVWCVSVPSTFVVARREGTPFISGNCQNLPQGVYRDPFRMEKGLIAAADFANQEMRTAAVLAKEQAMIDFFIHGDAIYGDDLHMSTANKMAKVQTGRTDDLPAKDTEGYGEAEADQRQKAKIIGFSILYGKSTMGFANDWGIEEEEAQGFVDGFLGAYPDLSASMVQWRKDAFTNGYILCDITLDRRWFSTDFEKVEKKSQDVRAYYPDRYWRWGTPKHEKDKIKEEVYEQYPFVKDLWRKFFGVKGSIERRSVNYRVQGTSAGESKAALVLIRKEIIERNLPFYLCNAVHDEILVFTYDETKKEELKTFMVENMERGANLFLNPPIMKADCEVGNSWIH